MNAALTLDPAGRVVLPITVRKALGLTPGSRLLLSVEGQVVTLTPAREAIRTAQALLAPYRPAKGALLSEALVAERREEYRKESEGDTPRKARGGKRRP